MPNYLPFDPNPRRPQVLPPPKTCDSQFHVLGPKERYPVRPGAAYEMSTATWEAALRVHRALGIECYDSVEGRVTLLNPRQMCLNYLDR